MTNKAIHTFTKTEIFVNEIVFYDKEEISLLGFLHDGGKFYETEFVVSRNHLKVLLSGNKKCGIEVLWRMEQLFVFPHQVPAIINMVELFGTTQVFEAGEIVLNIPFWRDEDGAVLPGNTRDILFVDTITINTTQKTF